MNTNIFLLGVYGSCGGVKFGEDIFWRNLPSRFEAVSWWINKWLSDMGLDFDQARFNFYFSGISGL